MVLHHVSQGARAVIKVPSGAHPNGLGQGDLDIGNALSAPQGLKQGVAKAQGRQILNRGLAQVMVNAQGLPLREGRSHDLVDFLRAGQVVAQRLFEDHAHLRAVDVRASELRADLGEQVWTGGQEKHHGLSATRIEPLLQARVVFRFGQVHGAVVKQLGKPVKFFTGRLLGFFHGVELVADEFSVLCVGALVAGDSQDPPPSGQFAVTPGLKEGRHQFAPGQVARTAEEHKIEGHDYEAPSG